MVGLFGICSHSVHTSRITACLHTAAGVPWEFLPSLRKYVSNVLTYFTLRSRPSVAIVLVVLCPVVMIPVPSPVVMIVGVLAVAAMVLVRVRG